MRIRDLISPLLRFVAGLGVAIWAGAALAQQGATPPPAMLVADDVYLEGNERLVATGNVEALYDGRRLRAQRIIYDRQNDRLLLTGPIVIVEGEERIILADEGEIDQQLENGILRGARMIMGDHVQLAARELNRSGGRFNQLAKVSVTSCRVCEDGRAPLWQIRARRVIHDQQAQQLYFEDAQFRVMDTPIFYLPRLRLPDPTLERAAGFLIPSLHSSSVLGVGVKVPYFVPIGDHKDITITPFVTDKTRTLELRYRQAFRNGKISFEGAISDDELTTRNSRGYVFGEGEFRFRNGIALRFDIEAVSDDSYLLDYSHFEKDRLDSEIELEFVDRDSYRRGALTYYHTLRPGENSATLPTAVFAAELQERVQPSWMAGEFRVGYDMLSYHRTSDLIVDGADFDPWADGHDVGRLTFYGDWRHGFTLAGGILGKVRTGLSLDVFEVQQAGATSRDHATEVTPEIELELRWPFLNAMAGGATHVIEPMVSLAYVGGSNPFVPNGENTYVEFDEGNLLSTSRFNGPDRRERGFLASYGLAWTRFAPSGWQSSLALGQVIRDEQQLERNGTDSFTSASGLNGEVSDLLVAAQVKSGDNLVLTARSLFDDDLDSSKAEARASWQTEISSLGATYIWLESDPAENRPTRAAEWAVDASYRFATHWTASADWRYDVQVDDPVRAGFGLTYTNECVDISLKASRRYTSSAVLQPSTDISLTVGLRGFTTKTEDKSYVRTCSK